MRNVFNKSAILAGMAGATMLAFGQSALAATELTVYTAVETEDLARYADMFNQDHPDIKIRWVRDSTGIVTAKLLAEKNNPQADVVWGLAATSLLLLKSEGMLEPYKPKGVGALDKKFVDKGAVPSWVGMGTHIAAVCYNTVEAANNNLSRPEEWTDLIKPMYKGHLVMPNPNSSGTGFLNVSGWLQMFGKDGGWAFMDRLHENIVRYTHSGSRPCELAATGEISIGISLAFHGAKLKTKGAPIDIIVPKEGVGWDMKASAIIVGTDKLEAAQKLIDWTITKKANEMYNTGYAMLAYPGVAKPVEHVSTNLLEKMIDNDFEFAANNRRSILAEWQKRYDSKSEAK